MVDHTARRVEQSRRRAHRLGNGWHKIRHQVLQEEPSCRLCGAPAVDVDHIVPLARGGTSDRDNLQGLCQTCHREKCNQEMELGKHMYPPDDEVFIEEIEGLCCKVHLGYRDDTFLDNSGWKAWVQIRALARTYSQKSNANQNYSGFPKWSCSASCHHFSKQEAYICAVNEIQKDTFRLQQFLKEFPSLLTLDEVAVRFGVTYRTARRWVSQGKFPVPVSVPGWIDRNLWRWSDVETWGQHNGRLK